MTRGFRNAILMVGAITILVPMLSRATEPPIELQRNPFERPAVDEMSSGIATLNEEQTAGHSPSLRAVLVAGSKSVVDFGGVILQIGDSANGYLLLSVEENRAIFSRNDKKVIFLLYERESSEDR